MSFKNPDKLKKKKDKKPVVRAQKPEGKASDKNTPPSKPKA
jgi:hypothetical protein